MPIFYVISRLWLTKFLDLSIRQGSKKKLTMTIIINFMRYTTIIKVILAFTLPKYKWFEDI